jgi:hypothetical protein
VSNERRFHLEMDLDLSVVEVEAVRHDIMSKDSTNDFDAVAAFVRVTVHLAVAEAVRQWHDELAATRTNAEATP